MQILLLAQEFERFGHAVDGDIDALLAAQHARGFAATLEFHTHLRDFTAAVAAIAEQKERLALERTEVARRYLRQGLRRRRRQQRAQRDKKANR